MEVLLPTVMEASTTRVACIVRAALMRGVVDAATELLTEANV